MRFKNFKKTFSSKSLHELVGFIRDNVNDPRKKGHGRTKYSLEYLLFIIVIATICGMRTYRQIERFTCQSYFH